MVPYIIKMLTFLNGIRIFPLFILYKIMLMLGDNGAKKFRKDLQRFNGDFFYTLFVRKQYIALLYARLGYISYFWKPFCGNYPISIDSRHNMVLGGGVHMEHPHGTHIHAQLIGENLTIKHNVTIGVSHNHGALPVIGNNVFIGCGACVLGNVKISDNVTIGANAVVVKDVPADAVVVGNPAKIIKLKGEKVDIPLTSYSK